VTAKKQSRKGRKMDFKNPDFPMLVTNQGICFQGLEAGSFPLRRRVFAVKKMVFGTCLREQLFHNEVSGEDL
jgi:hypothetical protein